MIIEILNFQELVHARILQEHQLVGIVNIVNNSTVQLELQLMDAYAKNE